MLARITALTLALFTSVGALGQSTVLIQDSFRLVPRPHGDRGRIRDVFIHTGLQDFWTILPGVAGARWSAPADDPKWIFSASSIDALEWPEPEPGFNGTASGQAHSAALIPFTLPSSSVTAHVEVVQFYGFPDGLKLGFTASSVLSDNFSISSLP